MRGDLATSLREVWDAKKNLRHTLKVPRDIPFNKYINYYPWLGEDILEDDLVYDFTWNRYSQEGVPVLMGDISEFIRLSSATKWQDGQFVEVGDNVPRISDEGLLIEGQRTNEVLWSQDLTQWEQTGRLTTSLESDPRFGQVTRLSNTGGDQDRPLGSGAYVEAEGRAQVTIVCKPEPECVLIGHSRRDRANNTSFIVDFDSLVITGYYNGLTGTVKDIGGGYYKIEIDWVPHSTSNLFRHLGLLLGETSSDLLIAYVQLEQGAFPTSYIPTEGSAVTRAPDILNIPLLPPQTITGDLDAGVTYSLSGGIATLAGHGYIRNIVVMLTPVSLFKGGEKGFWIEPDDSSTLFQNSNGTISVVDGDPIGLVLDKSGNNYNLKQTVSASRPELLDGGIVFDKVDDALTLDVPAGGITGTLFLATTRGTASYGASMPAGVWTLGNAYNPLGNVVSAVLVDRVLTEDEKARLHVFGIGKGGTEFGVETTFEWAYLGWSHLVDFPLIDTSSGTNFQSAWYFCSGLLSFPLIDTSSGTNFYSTWRNCYLLSSFPVLDVSSGTDFSDTWLNCHALISFPLLDVNSGTKFYRTWSGCRSLTSFPDNFFDNCLATIFTDSFRNTNLSQESIDGILVSINSNATSGGTFNQSGGSAPSIVGQEAIDEMRARGWAITVTGDY